MLRFLKKSEFDFYHDKLKEKLDKVDEKIKILDERLVMEVKAKSEQYSQGCQIIEKRIDEHMEPLRQDMKTLLKTR